MPAHLIQERTAALNEQRDQYQQTEEELAGTVDADEPGTVQNRLSSTSVDSDFAENLRLAVPTADPYVLSCDYIKHSLQMRNIVWDECPELPEEPKKSVLALRKLGRKFESGNLQTLAELSEEFPIEPTTMYADFREVSEGIFSDNRISWGRIVALFAWSGVLAARCYRRNRKDLIRNVAEWLAIFTETRLCRWVDEHDGWEGLVEFSENPVEQNRILKWPVMIGVGAVGLGAVALGAIFARRI